MEKINNKILVCYLITKFDKKNSFQNFVEKYNKFKSGIDHDLLICFKLLKNEEILLIKNCIKTINYIEYIDEFKSNDYDLGSFNRVAKSYPSRLIFFLNGNSYPNCDDWLKKVFDNYEDNSIIGTSASNLSLLSTLRLKKIYKIISYFFKLIKYRKIFNKFPNPHIRTNGFLIKSDDFINFMKNKNLCNKEDAWSIESGKLGLTNSFKSKGYHIYVVNSDGKKFEEVDWKLSLTFNYLSQNKFIISDNQIRKYLSINDDEKKLFQFKTWGY